VDNTYYAELIIRRNGEVFAVDARPSDSIAVALRMDARIYAEEALLERVSLEIAEAEAAGEGEGSRPGAGEGEEAPRMDAESLKEHLRKLNPEDFGRFTP